MDVVTTVNDNSYFEKVATEMKDPESTMLLEGAQLHATMALAVETAKLVDAQRIANLLAAAESSLTPLEVRRALKDEAFKRMGVSVTKVAG